MGKKLALLMILGFVVAGATACGGGEKQRQSNNFGDAPEWSASPPDGCGVGIVKYRGNRGMARSTATSRARDNLSRQLETTVEGMIKDYQAQGATRDDGSFSEERTTQVSRQLVQQTLVGTKTAATFITEGNEPHYYTLVCLKPEAFKGAFDKMDELSKAQRKALKNRAEREFDDLDEQLRKKGLK